MADDLRHRSMQILLNQVSSGRYPSVTMLNRIEASVTDRETADEYVRMLLDTLEQDTYPSPTMLDRVLGLVDALERAAPEE